MRDIIEIIDRLVDTQPALEEHLAPARNRALFTAPELMTSVWQEVGLVLARVSPEFPETDGDIHAIITDTE